MNKLTAVETCLKNLTGVFTFPFGLFTVKQNCCIAIKRYGKVDRIANSGLKWVIVAYLNDDLVHNY